MNVKHGSPREPAGKMARRSGRRAQRGGLGARQVEGAEVALVHNEGGILSSHCTLILANAEG